MLTALLNTTLFLFMLGLGSELKAADLFVLREHKRAAIVGILAQLLLLPLVCLPLYFVLTPELYLGFLLLALSPAGPSANFFVDLGKGNVALSIALTTISSLLSIVTMPIMIQVVAAKQFQPDPMRVLTQIGLFVLLPLVIASIGKRQILPYAKQLKIVAVTGLAVAITLLIYQSSSTLTTEAGRVFLCALYLLCVSMSLAGVAARSARVERTERIAIICEVGTQNAAQAMAIANSVFQSTTMALPGLAYAILMYPVIAIAMARMRRP